MINGAERIDDCDPPCVPVNNASDTSWQSKIAVKISIYKDWHVDDRTMIAVDYWREIHE